MKRFGPVAVAAVFALGAPAHAAETVLFTSGNWGREAGDKATWARSAVFRTCSTRTRRLPPPSASSSQFRCPSRGYSVKMAPLPGAIQQIASPRRCRPRRSTSRALSSRKLTRGAVVGYMVAGHGRSVSTAQDSKRQWMPRLPSVLRRLSLLRLHQTAAPPAGPPLAGPGNPSSSISTTNPNNLLPPDRSWRLLRNSRKRRSSRRNSS